MSANTQARRSSERAAVLERIQQTAVVGAGVIGASCQIAILQALAAQQQRS